VVSNLFSFCRCFQLKIDTVIFSLQLCLPDRTQVICIVHTENYPVVHKGSNELKNSAILFQIFVAPLQV
jgi:hypothetical protein